MVICWNCKSDIGELYKICPICHTMLEDVVCHRCGKNKTDICTESGYLFGKPLWIESEREDSDGNWDGTYLCKVCWERIHNPVLNPCCICGRHESKKDIFGKPIWYPYYDNKGEWNEKYICYYCYIGRSEDKTEDEIREEELEKDRIDLNSIDHHNIQNCRQNIPELIVRDCIREFNFDDEEAERLRIILIARGVNKCLFARREFIRLKHNVKEMLKSKESPYNRKDVHKVIEIIYSRMQNIARLPRWIWWPITITHKWKKIEDKIVIKGRHN